MSLRTLVTLLTFALAVAAPAVSSAQAFGLGPRFSFVRGDIPSDTPSTRFLGGTVRMRSSERVVLEVAMDYRTELSEDGTSRLRERPLQGSMLLFPVRSTFSPYVLAGLGLYSQTTDELDETGLIVSSTQSRRTGMHLGFGAELFIGRRAALFADYRYRFVRFGSAEEDSDSIDIPGLSSLKLSHRGSMWTSGVAFYF
jgi:opacity protein-like surface antigen